MRFVMIVTLLLISTPLGRTAGWKLAWNDEFNGSALDPTKWGIVVGGNGFGNNELEYYTGRPENLSLEDGMLVIRAIKEDYTGLDGVKRGFTSARIHTQDTFSQCYGRFEAR